MPKFPSYITAMRNFSLLSPTIVVLITLSGGAYAQLSSPPNPYRDAVDWGKLPEGRKLGPSSAIDIDPKGNIWVADRCSGRKGCADSVDAPIFEFDASGKLLKNFGAGLFVYPHGIHVDRDGNVWVTDARGQNGKGQQVTKFSPEGKVLMKLGKAGVDGETPDTFNGPCDVLVAPNGDIFVADGHENSVSRIMKFSKDGKFIKQWGKKGSAPGEFDTPHGIAMDSAGRLFVGDRANSRIQIFDQDGKLLDTWTQYGRASGIAIDKNDVLYSADSESNSRLNPGVKRGIYIGSAKSGKLTAFIPYESVEYMDVDRTHGVEGLAVDGEGSVYAVAVFEMNLKKYSRQ